MSRVGLARRLHYTFNILVYRLKSANGELTGFALSVLIANSLDPKVSGAAFYTDMYMVVGPVLVVGYGLRVGGMNDLESTCQQIIADFDTKTLDSLTSRPPSRR